MKFSILATASSTLIALTAAIPMPDKHCPPPTTVTEYITAMMNTNPTPYVDSGAAAATTAPPPAPPSPAESAPPAESSPTIPPVESLAPAPISPPTASTTHKVLVGGPGNLFYDPQVVHASIGDVVKFEFLAVNHTLSESTFDVPCKKKEGGFETGFMANSGNVKGDGGFMKEMVVEGKEPRWFYCKQGAGGHCRKGMVFALNPTVEKTFQLFRENAISQAPNSAAPSPPPPPSPAMPSASDLPPSPELPPSSDLPPSSESSLPIYTAPADPPSVATPSDLPLDVNIPAPSGTTAAGAATEEDPANYSTKTWAYAGAATPTPDSPAEDARVGKGGAYGYGYN